MNTEQLQQFKDMQQQIEELTRWKKERENQQIQNPIDSNSQDILYKDVLLFKRSKAMTIVARGIITVEINGNDYNLIYQ